MKEELYQIAPIGIFHGLETALYSLPRQPGLKESTSGIIELFQHMNFEQALSDLEGFDKIWVLFLFHKVKSWKPKVLPPRGGVKKGLFSTRSPHRPNPIGLSCVSLKKIIGRSVYVEDHDLLDKSPIIDIKPYIPYADSYPMAKAGWVDQLESNRLFLVELSEVAQREAEWIELNVEMNFIKNILYILSNNPFPYPQNRITIASQKNDSTYILGYKSWRVHFRVCTVRHSVEILEIRSGYDEATLTGVKQSPWGDVDLHLFFIRLFSAI
jgi:tRNA (adenine37-N6)-methyltransferase